MEREAVAGERGDALRDLWGVRVSVLGGMRTRLLLIRANGGDRGFDAEAALTATALRGGIFGGGE